MVEWWPAGGPLDAIVAAKKGWLLGADVIRERRVLARDCSVATVV